MRNRTSRDLVKGETSERQRWRRCKKSPKAHLEMDRKMKEAPQSKIECELKGNAPCAPDPKRDGAHQPSRRKHEGVPTKSWRRKELKALPKCPNACLDTPLRAKEEVTETKVSGNAAQEGTQAHQKGRIAT